MIEHLFRMVSDQSQDLIVKNNAVPNQYNDAAVGEAANSIVGELKKSLAQGNLEGPLSLLGGKSSPEGNEMVNNMSSSFSQNLSGKYGVDKSVAVSIATALIPVVIAKFVAKTNNPNDPTVDLNGVFSDLTDGQVQNVDFCLPTYKLGTSSGSSAINQVRGMLGGGANRGQGTVGDTIGKMVGNMFK